ncbi:MAG: DUF2079 domain-containing protein [Candidatus Kerfeldbacteria bacterium]
MTLPKFKVSTWVIVIATILIASVNVVFSCWHHSHYETHAFDLGIFDQAVWHLSHLEAPASTVRGLTNLFGDHFHPILLLIAPVYRVVPSPYVLLVIQALLFAAVIPLLFLLARQLRIPEWPSAVITLAVGINPGLTTALGFDFHELAFALPLFVASFLFAEKKRWLWFTVTLALLILTKESLAVYAAGIGFAFLIRKWWRPALITLTASVTAYLLITLFVIPAFSSGQGFPYWDQYRHLAASPLRLPFTFLHHPLRFISAFADSSEKIQTMLLMLGSFAFMPLLSITTLPLLLITFAERFWSDLPTLWLFQFHYQIMPVAVMAVASLYTLSVLSRRRWWQPVWTTAVAALMLAGTLFVHTRTGSIRILWNPSVSERPTAMWNKALSTIPSDASVSALDAFVPHLSERNTIYRYPRIRDAQWIVLDPRAPSFPLSSADISIRQEQYRNDASWKLIQSDGPLTIFLRDDTSYIPDPPEDPATRR